jgi:hypothetical protein
MNTTNIQRYLESFGKYVVKQSRTILSKKKKNVTKELYNSIKFQVDNNADGMSVKFFMADYGKFVDKGVSGNKKIQEYKTWKGKRVESPYKYTSKMPPPSILSKWVKKRGLKGRDQKSGRFITNLSLAYILARKIKRDGIKGISFFQRPLQLALKHFGKDYLDAFKQDIIESIKTT